MLSHFSCVQFCVTLWTVAYWTPQSLGFSRQEYWSGCHALLQRIFPTQRSNLYLWCLLHWQAGSLSLAPPGKPIKKAGWWRIDAFGLVVLEKTLESPLDSKEIKPVNPKGNQPWILIGKTDAEAPILWSLDVNQPKSQLIGKDTERLRTRGEGGNRGWDDWMASLTQWTRVWANSGRQWRTGKPGMLQFMGSQNVWHNLVTEKQQWYNKSRQW